MISIPDDLRADINATLAAIEASHTNAARQQETFSSELASLKTEASKLQAEISSLHLRALKDSAAVDELLRAEKRAALIKDRQAQVQDELASIEPVRLADAQDLLRRVVGFYSTALKSHIADALAPYCPDRQRCYELAGLTDAFTHLRGISHRANSLGLFAITNAVVADIEAILRRALAGAPLLASDSPQKKEDAA